MAPGFESVGSQSRRETAGAAVAGPGYESESDSGLWAVLAGTANPTEFCQSWLAIQCRLIPAVEGGVVLLLLESEGSYAPAAVWPDVRRDMSYLTQAAQRALLEGRGLVMPAAAAVGASATGSHLAYPIGTPGRLRGVVVLQLAPRGDAELQVALRQLYWGAAGLELLFSRQDTARETATKQRLQAVLELIAAAAGHERFSASAMALVTQLATHLHCERVCLGFRRGGRVHVDAVSHSAQFQERTNLMRSVASAMEEAIDQGATITFPPIEGAQPAVNRSHEELTSGQGSGGAMSVPLAANGKVVGAITLERAAEQPFSRDAAEFVEALAGLAGPMLDVHRREDQWFAAHLAWWLRDLGVRLFGPRRAGFKLGSAILAMLLAWLIFGQGDYRVSATTSLEPLVQQAAVAPFNGYIREAHVRAGDLVQAGQVLAVLDDRELRLERLKWLGQQEEVLKQLRQAMAEHNAAQTQILSAQLDQARAQVARAEDQLGRTRVTVPFEGVVVSGDLTQQLGAPVERGTVLYEVAPLAQYRVVLRVDERDVARVQVGQKGNILLSAFPNDPIAFTVEKMTPVSTAKEGRNYFRVEAQLARLDARLRPGMEGVGKIEIDRRSWVWIWTHDIWESIRLAVWKWLP